MVRTPRKRGREDDVDDSHSVGGTPLKRSTGSPSARYLAELSLQNQHYNKELLSRLENQERAAGKTHREALLAAAKAHERVRRQAQLEQERERLAVEEESKRQEAEERRLLDLERQRKVEREIEEERRRAEEAKRLEDLQHKAEQERKQHEAEAREREERRLEQQKQEDRTHQENQRRADEEAKKREAEQQAEQQKTRDYQPSTNSTGVASSGSESNVSSIISPVSTRDAEHRKYLDLHKRLKDLRINIMEQIKPNKALKTQVGEWRREVRSWVGKATNGKGGTLKPRDTISTVLVASQNIQQPSVDIRRFLVSKEVPQGLAEGDYQVSGIFLYLINILAKRLISQWIDVAGADIAEANHTGVLAISLFAIEKHLWRGVSLIDVLLAKFHKTCPVLFGIYGPDNTVEGKKRLGWRIDNGTSRFVPEQRHGERMQGLGAGFSALALRHFPAQSKLVNPYPPSHWWTALARIINTPQAQVTDTHLIVLKAMIEAQPVRILEVFKSAGRVALRTALLDFPKKAQAGPARTGIETLPAMLKKKHPELSL